MTSPIPNDSQSREPHGNAEVDEVETREGELISLQMNSDSFWDKWGGVLVGVFAGVLLLANIGLMPLWGSEGRWAVISRYMYRTGDLLQPVLGTGTYWDKPLLSYWVVLPFARLFGGVTEAAVRLPSVAAALVLLACTFDLARTWFGCRVGIFSMLVLTTSYGFVFWGRNAQVEMLNAAVIMWSLWYFLKHRSCGGSRWFYVMGAVAALGANLKGLPAFAVPGFCILALSLVQRDWRWIPPWYHCVGATVLTLVIYFSFPLASRWVTGDWGALQLVWQENVMRFVGKLDHKDPVWTYFVRIFDLAGPWSLLLPAALYRYAPRLRERSSSATAELLLLFIGVFVFFTLSGSRRPYYLLPILPFSAILVALLLSEFREGSLSRRMNTYVKGFAVLIGLVLAAPLAVLVVAPETVLSSATVPKATLLKVSTVLALTGGLVLRSGLRRRTRWILGGISLCWVIYVFWGIPLASVLPSYRTDVAEVVALNRPCAFLSGEPAKFLYYLDEPYAVFNEEGTAYQWAAKEGGVLIVQDDVPSGRWTWVVHSRTWDAVVPIGPGSVPNYAHKAKKMSLTEAPRPPGSGAGLSLN